MINRTKVADSSPGDSVMESRRVCVGAIISDLRHRVFVMRRVATAAVAPGAWDIAGGHVKTGESDEEALAREVFEETGWILRVVREQIGVWQWSHGGITRLERDYLIEVDGNLAAPSLDRREHDAWMWLDSTALEILTEPTTGDKGSVTSSGAASIA